MKNIQVCTGQIIGLDHTRRQVNCQDSHTLIESDDYLVGVVCDGCGEGLRSEVGAALATGYIAGQAAGLLEDGFGPEAIPGILHQRTLSYLDNLVALTQPVNRVQFIQNHLLFTIVGLILTEGSGVIFTAGDGLLAMDEETMDIDQSNRPAYIAYHLLQDHLEDRFHLPDGFQVVTLPPDWQRLAITSDGFVPELLPQVWRLKHPRGLQRKLNVWANQERRFQDDATIIAVERFNHEAGRD